MAKFTEKVMALVNKIKKNNVVIHKLLPFVGCYTFIILQKCPQVKTEPEF